jgi:hypothetical protein
MDKSMPAAEIKLPVSIMRLMPMRLDSLPEQKLPSM